MHILDKTEAYYWLTIDTCSKQNYGIVKRCQEKIYLLCFL